MKTEELLEAILSKIPTKTLTDELARRIGDGANVRPSRKPTPTKTPVLVDVPKPAVVRTKHPLRYVVDVIADARSTHGLSVREIAELCVVSPETIYRYAKVGQTRGGSKRASMARGLVEAIVGLTNYGRKTA